MSDDPKILSASAVEELVAKLSEQRAQIATLRNLLIRWTTQMPSAHLYADTSTIICATAAAAQEHDREVARKALEAAATICDEVAESYPASGEDTGWTEAQVCARGIRLSRAALSAERPEEKTR